jgi:hypothetical protein
MNRYILVALVGVLLAPRPSASELPDQQDAMKKLEEAVSKTNIFELPSFQMKATWQVDRPGKPLDGSYQLLWNGPERWREEITFPLYTEVQIGAKEGGRVAHPLRSWQRVGFQRGFLASAIKPVFT